MHHLINYSECQRSLPASPARETPISRLSSKRINGKKENEGKRKEKWHTKCPARRGHPSSSSSSRPFTQTTHVSHALSSPTRYKFKIKVRHLPSTSHDSCLAARGSSCCCSKWGCSWYWGWAEFEATRLSFQSSLVLMYPQELGRGLAWRGHRQPVGKREKGREREREKRKNRQRKRERVNKWAAERARESCIYTYS